MTPLGISSPLRQSTTTGPCQQKKGLGNWLHQLRQTILDPQIGRWITPDPAGFADGPNLYAYVKNNPMILFDPYGLSAWDYVCDFTTDLASGIAEGCYEVVCETASLAVDIASFTVNAIDDPVGTFTEICEALSDIAEGIQNLDAASIQDAIVHEINSTCEAIKNMDTKGAGKMLGRSFGSKLIREILGAVKGLRSLHKTAKKGSQVAKLNKDPEKKENKGEKSDKKGRSEHLKPDPTAKGDHSTIKRHGETGEITHYETYRKQTNPKNPNEWETTKRYDATGKGHYNKSSQKDIGTPHIHDPTTPGEIRVPEPDEIPNRK